MYSVGSLAEASGLTVRTLHHWDEIGLLRPAERSGAGHRRYSPADVQRLYRIVALRGLGLSLEDVAAALAQEGPDLREAVKAHLARVDSELAHLRDQHRRLEHILAAFDHSGAPTTDQLMEAIMAEQLRERREALGEEGMANAERDWADLIAEMDAARRAGTDPADAHVQALADRWRALITQFTGGDAGIASSLKRLYAEQGAEKASRGALDAEVMEYAGRALSVKS